MNGRGACPQLHSVSRALFDDLRLFQLQILRLRHHNAVSLFLHLVQRHTQPLIGCAGFGKLTDRAHQIGIVFNRQAAFLRNRFIKEPGAQLQLHASLPACGIDFIYPHGCNRRVFPELAKCIAEFRELMRRAGTGIDLLPDFLPQLICRGQSAEPCRHFDCNGAYGKFEQ